MSNDAQILSEVVVEDPTPTNGDMVLNSAPSAQGVPIIKQTLSDVGPPMSSQVFSTPSTPVVTPQVVTTDQEASFPTPVTPPQAFSPPSVLPNNSSPISGIVVNSAQPPTPPEPSDIPKTEFAAEPVTVIPEPKLPLTTPPENNQPRKKANFGGVTKTVKALVATIAVIAVFGSGGYVLAYRYAPSVFYRITPASISSKVNALWPLHQDFAEMLPADTELLAAVNFGRASGQTDQLNKILNRIPGLASLNNQFQSDISSTLESEYGISLSNDIANTFSETIYIAVPRVEGNSSILAAIKVKDIAKGQELLTKLQSSSSGKKLFPQKETYHGVDIYIMKSSSVNIPSYTNLLQALNFKNASDAEVRLAQSTSCAPGDATCEKTPLCDGSTFCGTSTPTIESVSPAITVLDRFVVLGGSASQIKEFIDQNQQKSSSLKSNQSYLKVSQEKPSLASVYVNIESLVAGIKKAYPSNQDSATAYLDAIKGYKSWSGQVSAEDLGFVLRGELFYDSSVTDATTTKVLADKDSDLFYSKTLPVTTGFFGEEGNLGAKIEQIANLKYTDNQTVGSIFYTNYGIKLNELASTFSGKYSLAYLPKSDSGLVMQAEVKDAKALSAYLDTVKSNVEKLFATAGYGINVQYQDVSGTTITTFDVGDFYDTGYDTRALFSPSYAIKDNRLILSSNFNGVKDLVTLSGETLDGDEIMKNDIKTVGVPSRLFVYANSRKIYYGVVDSIRALTGNIDLAQSDQEKVTDALLSIFTSVTCASHSEANHNSGITTIPVVALPKEKFDEIDKLISEKASSIFDLTPYVNPLNNNVVDAYDSNDGLRKSDVEEILSVVIAANAGSSTFNMYETSGDVKLDPASGVMKEMIDAGDLSSEINDPDWPEYYYTMSNDGIAVKVTALLETKPDDTGNCEPSKQIRGRWTWCVKQ